MVFQKGDYHNNDKKNFIKPYFTPKWQRLLAMAFDQGATVKFPDTTVVDQFDVKAQACGYKNYNSLRSALGKAETEGENSLRLRNIPPMALRAKTSRSRKGKAGTTAASDEDEDEDEAEEEAAAAPTHGTQSAQAEAEAAAAPTHRTPRTPIELPPGEAAELAAIAQGIKTEAKDEAQVQVKRKLTVHEVNQLSEEEESKYFQENPDWMKYL